MDPTNTFGLLSLNSVEEETSQPKPVEAEVEDEEEVWLDSFLLSLIFSQVKDGPTLAQLRLVRTIQCGPLSVCVCECRRLP
jgi:hypothetical protein